MSKHHHHGHYGYYNYPTNNFSLKNILSKAFDLLLKNFLSSKGLLTNSASNGDYGNNNSYGNNGGLLNTILGFANGFNNNNYRGDSMSNSNNNKNHKNEKSSNIDTSELGDTLNSILQNIDMNQILQILAANTTQNNNRTKNSASSNNNEQNPLASLINGLTSPEILEQLTEALNKSKNNK